MPHQGLIIALKHGFFVDFDVFLMLFRPLRIAER